MQPIFTVKHCNECDSQILQNFTQDEMISSHVRMGKNYYVVFYQDKPFGIFQYFFHQNNILVDYAISNEFRGKKHGKDYLHFLHEYLSSIHQDCPYIVLCIAPDNLASIKIAEQNGFYPDYGMDEEDEMFELTPYVKSNSCSKNVSK